MLTLGEFIERARDRGVELRYTEFFGSPFLLVLGKRIPLPSDIDMDDELPNDFIWMVCAYCPGLDAVVDCHQDPELSN